MKVYIVLEPDADPYCGSHIQAVFRNEVDAKKLIKGQGKYTDWEYDEWEVQSSEGTADE